jgi:hypothetical protein
MRFLLALAVPALLLAQTASFPSAVATDDDLLVASDAARTTLLSGIGAGDTTIPLTSTTMFKASPGGSKTTVILIGQEFIKVCAFASQSATVCSGGRGYSGSTASSHASGSVVVAPYASWYHNRLREEIKAMQNALGPNLQNLKTFDTLIKYNFQPQLIASPLSAGVSATVTASPCPLGVSGTNTNHKLYISGGTGTPEAVLITGGSCTSGAFSGTLTFTPANSHTGSTFESSSSGIQEAHNAMSGPTGGTVVVARGTWPIYGTITITKHGFKLFGEGRIATVLAAQPSLGSQPIISLPAFSDAVVIEDLQLDNSAGTGYAISAVNQSNLHVERVTIVSGNGISFTGTATTQFNTVRDVFINLVTGTGVYIDSAPEAGGTFEHLVIGGDEEAVSSVGFRVRNGVGMWLRRSYGLGLAQGLLVDPGNGQAVGVLDLSGAYFDGYYANSFYGIHLSPTGTGSIAIVRITDSSTDGFQYGVVADGSGVLDGVQVSQHQAIGNKVNGYFLVNARNFTCRDCVATANSLLSPGSFDGFFAQPAGSGVVDKLQVLGGTFAQAFNYGTPGGENTQRLGIYIDTAVTNALVANARVTPNVSGSISNASTTSVIIDNPGYNPVGISSITVTASPMTYTAGASPETVYINGGSVSGVTRGGITVCAASPCQVTLPPNKSMVVTYSSAPTMVKDVN